MDKQKNTQEQIKSENLRMDLTTRFFVPVRTDNISDQTTWLKSTGAYINHSTRVGGYIIAFVDFDAMGLNIYDQLNWLKTYQAHILEDLMRDTLEARHRVSYLEQTDYDAEITNADAYGYISWGALKSEINNQSVTALDFDSTMFEKFASLSLAGHDGKINLIDYAKGKSCYSLPLLRTLQMNLKILDGTRITVVKLGFEYWLIIPFGRRYVYLDFSNTIPFDDGPKRIDSPL